MKNITLILAFFQVFVINAQSVELGIKNINTVAEAELYVKNHLNGKGQIMTINPQLEEEAAELFSNKGVGYTASSHGYVFKILETKKVRSFRVSYIFLGKLYLFG